MYNLEEINKRKPVKCELCQSADVRMKLDVGSDIDGEGEEHQHLDICNSCGASRLFCERWVNFSDYQIFEGNWSSKDDCPPFWFSYF